MNIHPVIENKNKITLLILILTSLHIFWDYYHGGVPTHHIFASGDFPGFSNWWGLLTLPLLTWVVITLVQKRVSNVDGLNSSSNGNYPEIITGFLGALSFGVLMSLFWSLGLEETLQYLIFLPVLVSFFKAVYYPEHFLGFVLGMAFTFGGVLPIFFGIIILFFCLIAFKIIRQGIIFLIAKLF